jgi:hypothetical protein
VSRAPATAQQEIKVRLRDCPSPTRTLPPLLKILTVMTTTTLADMRELVEKYLPAECRERETWRYVADQTAPCRPRHQRGGDRLAASVAARAGAMPAAVTAE